MWKNIFSFDGRIRRMDCGVSFSSTRCSIGTPQKLNFRGEDVNPNGIVIPYLVLGIGEFACSITMDHITVDISSYNIINSNSICTIMCEIYSYNNYFDYHFNKLN